MAFFWLPGRKGIAPLLAVGGALFILIYQHAFYYEPASEQSMDFKLTAASLRPQLPPGALIADAAPSGFFNVMSWYFDQSPPNPLAVQSLEPGASPVALRFLSGPILDDERGSVAPYIKGAMGDLGQVAAAHNATIYTFHVDRHPVAAIDENHRAFAFRANPKEFYSNVFRLENVRTIPFQRLPEQYITFDGSHTLEGGVVATQNNTDVFFEFVLDNRIADEPMRFLANMYYLNSGAGNQIGLFARFDDEPFMEFGRSAGPDQNRVLRMNFSRAAPFKRLTLQVRMHCKDETARYFGDNLRTLIFQGLEMRLVDGADPIPAPSP